MCIFCVARESFRCMKWNPIYSIWDLNLISISQALSLRLWNLFQGFMWGICPPGTGCLNLNIKAELGLPFDTYRNLFFSFFLIRKRVVWMNFSLVVIRWGWKSYKSNIDFIGRIFDFFRHISIELDWDWLTWWNAEVSSSVGNCKLIKFDFRFFWNPHKITTFWPIEKLKFWNNFLMILSIWKAYYDLILFLEMFVFPHKTWINLLANPFHLKLS